MTHRKKRHRDQNRGDESARQHIEEAKALTIELGGADQDLKSCFLASVNASLGPFSQSMGLPSVQGPENMRSRLYRNGNLGAFK